jgi:abortive infection bacteriophage resistance protein
MNTVIFIRNTCAHGGLLFDLNTPKEIAVTPLIKFNNNNNNRHSLDSAIKVILYFLSIISKDRKEEVELQIEELFSKYESNEVLNGIITKNIGYVKIVR